MDKRTVASAHDRIDGLEKEVIAIKTEVKIQFKDLFGRVKRMETILLSVAAAIIGLLINIIIKMPWYAYWLEYITPCSGQLNYTLLVTTAALTLWALEKIGLTFHTAIRATRRYSWRGNIDPFTLIAAATTAFNALKKGIEVGKDITAMGSQLGSWATAVADLDFIANKAASPPWYKSMSGSAQSEAIEIYAAKQQAAAMRDELRTYIRLTGGENKWIEFFKHWGQGS